jgi:RNA recognition motif-containing protein
VLALQRLVGNQAVAGLITVQRAGSAAGLYIQRSRRLYVGNLAFHSTEDSVRGAFERAGTEVLAVQVMTDRMTGQSRGFGFVEVAGEREVRAAVEALHGRELDGRLLTVNEARERAPGGGGGFRGTGGGGRGGGRGGGGRGGRGGRGDREDRW